MSRVALFIGTNHRLVSQLTTSLPPDAFTELLSMPRIWFIGDITSTSQTLLTQLKDLGIHTEKHLLNDLPLNAVGPQIFVLNAGATPLDEACKNIKTLRTRFATGTLVVHNLQADFTSIKAAQRAGTDHCFGMATHPSEIPAKLIDLCSHEEAPPFRVLVVEDSTTASISIQRTLKQSGIESQVVTDPAEILNRMRSYQPDLVLMDMFMPKCTGVEAKRVIRRHPEFLSTPIIYLSGECDMGLQVDALRLGDEYFLTKPFNPVFLNAVV